jgi:hypothetical protein
MAPVPQTTIIVRVLNQEPTTGFNLADVLISALGVTGVLTLGSLILGLALAGGFIWYRLRQRRLQEGQTIGADLRVTPGFVEYAARGQGQ